MLSGNLERVLSVALLVPLDDPSNPNCRWGLPTLLWGKSGIGKSGRVVQSGAAAGLVTRVVYPATHQPEDASGIPILDGKKGLKVECALPAIRELNEIGRGTLFIDELSCARPAVQAAFLSIIYERTWLKPGIRVLAAANPPEEAAGGWNLAPPMANRLAHFEVGVPTADEWVSWLFGSGAATETIDDGEKKIVEAWPTVLPKWKGLAAGFVKRTEGSLHALPKVGDKARSRAWPSPRMFEFALRASAACEALGHPGLVHDFMEGCLGEGTAREWATWIREADLPAPEDALRKGWVPDKRRLDICLAVCSAAINHALQCPDPKERKELALLSWKLLNRVDLAGFTDITVNPAKALIDAGFSYQAGADFREASAHLTQKFANYVQFLNK